MGEFRTGYPPEYYEALRAARARREADARAADRLMREAAELRHVGGEMMLRLAKPSRFTLREEHLTLLRHAYVGWQDCETGAPAIDPKRPYGNSDVERDVMRILGWEIIVEDEAAHENAWKHAEILHHETEEALQIVLLFGADAAPGEYEMTKSCDRRSWRKV